MQVKSEEYQSHGVFIDLARYVGFYEQLSMSIMTFPTMGTKSVINIDTYTFSSMRGTLESMRALLLDGRINDAYAILRKYYDSVIINVYIHSYLDEHFSIDNFIVTQIQKWLSGVAHLPTYGDMLKYIRNAPSIQPVTVILLSDDRYKKIRDRCNAHTHYNFYQHVLLNDNEIHLPSRGRFLDRSRNDVRNLFILHLAYVFFVNDKYMMSSEPLAKWLRRPAFPAEGRPLRWDRPTLPRIMCCR